MLKQLDSKKNLSFQKQTKKETQKADKFDFRTFELYVDHFQTCPAETCCPLPGQTHIASGETLSSTN